MFVKPVRDKAFTGTVINGPQDLIGCGSCYENYEVLCTEVLDIRREWRGFMIYDELIDLRPYKGDYHYQYDPEVIDRVVAAFCTIPNRLMGCSIDFAVISQGWKEADDQKNELRFWSILNIYAFVVKNMIFQLTGHADCDIIFFGDAAIAQSVVRNIGSVEVTGSIPVSSLKKNILSDILFLCAGVRREISSVAARTPRASSGEGRSPTRLLVHQKFIDSLLGIRYRFLRDGGVGCSCLGGCTLLHFEYLLLQDFLCIWCCHERAVVWAHLCLLRKIRFRRGKGGGKIVVLEPCWHLLDDGSLFEGTFLRSRESAVLACI